MKMTSSHPIGHRAIIVTQIKDVEDAGCDHGCRQVVLLTNVLDDSSWELCILSFENHISKALQIIECRAKGCTTKCIGCPYG
ncbi:MAG: hypothetical protein K6T83_12000 [Alicyclobacillus sp.]|nr:hypothetical protein [Alicyclobacillus sp.]